MANAAVLGSYIYAGRRCLASSTTCIATGVTLRGTDLDFVGYTSVTLISIPVRALSLTGAVAVMSNDNGGGTDGYLLAISAHSIIA